ncbi:MAG: hypothetical protein JXA58_05800 [Dehalococcoidia bacterium]|nr:hypothetical protein [Dehalococcoidia bacterium]
MRTSVRRAMLVLLAACLMGASLAGCGGEVSFTTASLSEATMCLGVDGDSKPLNPTDEFSVNTPEIFCSVKLSNAPDDTEVLAEWVYVKGEAEGVEDYVIDTVSVTAGGTVYMWFSLERPDTGWPVGEYELNLSVDGKKKETVPFTVTTGGAVTGPGGAALSEATMTLSVDSMSRPLEPTNIFQTDSPEIICSVLVSNASAGTELLSEWYYISGEWEGVTNQIVGTIPLAAQGTQYASLTLTIPDEGWPVGQYQVKLFLNGALQEAIPFDVESAPIRAVMAMSVDKDNNPVNPTSNFPVGVEKVYTVLYVKEAPAGAKMLVEWYDVGAAVHRQVSTYEGDIKASTKPTWVNSSYGTGGWPAGSYAVVITVNGERVLIVPFTVG